MNPFDLTGKVAIVTGGNGGIGLGIARGLVQAGATVAIAARNEAKTKAAVESLQAEGARALGVTVDGEARLLPAKVTMTMRCGDVFRHEQAGPGGWGDPLEREPARVLRDLRNELVSLEAARHDYGVVIDPATWTVDEAETARVREALRSTRPGPLPAVSR